MRQRIPLEIALPDFGDRVNFVERNRRFQAYRRWGYDQRNKGAPVTCWCLYIWIKGNNIADRNLRCDVIRVTKRPPGTTSNQWQNWRNHHRTGGLLSFPEYLARYNANAKKGQGYRQDLVGVPLGKRSIRKASAYMVEEPEEEIEPVPAPMPKKWPKHANGKRVEQPAVAGDQGLRMEPKSVIAKIERKLLAMGITRPA